jgi:16S rRNA (uracil1498-N3)-methyltransferase
MQLFYHPELLESATVAVFDKDESRHIIKVLRKKEGDQMLITNGKGFFFSSEITHTFSNKCEVKILKVEKQKPLPYHLHLAVAPTKLNDRYEWFLEKATEIGVSEITPIICEHSERTKIKPERYEKILLSAMKQSLKAYLPKLNDAKTFADFINTTSETKSLKCIAHCEKNEKKSLKSLIQKGSDTLILIGPEGDFSASEIAMATQKGFAAVTLGESRLRTETAAIVACHSVAFVNE